MSKTGDWLVQGGALIWFRNDLRIEDNPALQAGLDGRDRVYGLYVLECDQGFRPVVGAARWWLHQSLNTLAIDLARHGIRLIVRSGMAEEIVSEVAAEHHLKTVFWNRRYGPAERALDERIKAHLRERGVDARSFNASVLVEPWRMLTSQGKPYSVFTPFWRSLQQHQVPNPRATTVRARKSVAPMPVDTEYSIPAWARKLEQCWRVGEGSARQRLADFLERIEGYHRQRDFPAEDATSRLSPHLRFGEISPRQVYHSAQQLAQRRPELAEAVDKFLSELAWREFDHHQLYHRNNIADVPMQARFASMQWRRDEDAFTRWSRGQTGFPLIDAGMRELWQTGYMHNRVRMITASFLVKNLLIDWREGERWFWDCLVDADPANNPANWQWVAGSGLDAAPWFRIFNPILQGKRFDADGSYVRRWVPEISTLPNAWIHSPHTAPRQVLEKEGIVLGRTYPTPIVDLKATRERALAALQIR